MVLAPPIPTRKTRFENGTLRFEIMEGCAYCPSIPGFTGGDWTIAKLRTKEKEPAFIRLDGGDIIVEKLTDYLVDSYGNYVGGKFVELVRLNVCDQKE